MITKDTLNEQRADLLKGTQQLKTQLQQLEMQRQQWTADLNATEGAINLIDRLLAQMAEDEARPATPELIKPRRKQD